MKKRRDARETRRVLLLPTVLAFTSRCPFCGAILRIGIGHCHYRGAMLTKQRKRRYS